MTSSGAYVLVVVCEADADRRTATGLADRVLCQEVEWIEPESIDLHRRWQGLAEGSAYLEWRRTATLARERGLRPHGHFDGRPGAPDAYAARRALLLLALEASRLDAVLLIRDSDGEMERRTGLEQARAERAWPFPVVLGLAHPKRECWVLAGFEPRSDAERERLANARRSLGFDPRSNAHLLLASQRGAPRDAKRVLSDLTLGSFDREAACWMECDLEILRELGTETGLTAYLDEILEHLVPIFARR